MKTIFTLLFPHDANAFGLVEKAGKLYTRDEVIDIIVSAYILYWETGQNVELCIKKSYPKKDSRVKLRTEFYRKQKIDLYNKSRGDPEVNETLYRSIAQLPKQLRKIINDEYFNNSSGHSPRSLRIALSHLKTLILRQINYPANVLPNLTPA